MEVPATLESGGGLGQGKLRVTTERLIFQRKKMLGGSGDDTSFPLSSIQTVGLSGVLEKKLKVRAGSTELVFKASLMSASVGSTGDAGLKAISDLLQRAIAGEPLRTPDQAVAQEPSPVSTAPEEAARISTSWLDELERLAKLHAAGALTDEEFGKAKLRLLESR